MVRAKGPEAVVAAAAAGSSTERIVHLVVVWHAQVVWIRHAERNVGAAQRTSSWDSRAETSATERIATDRTEWIKASAWDRSLSWMRSLTEDRVVRTNHHAWVAAS